MSKLIINGKEVKMKKIVFTKEEDLWYSKLMGDNLNSGYSDLMAEKLTLQELGEKFPRLKPLLKSGMKIALQTKG